MLLLSTLATTAIASASPGPSVPDRAMPTHTCGTRTYATMAVATTGAVATGMIAPMLIAPNSEVGPALALGTAAGGFPMWIVSGAGLLASGRRCGDPRAVLAGSMFLATGLSVPVAAGLLGVGLSTGDLGGLIAGGLGALALGAVGVPALVVGTSFAIPVMVAPVSAGKPGIAVSGRF